MMQVISTTQYVALDLDDEATPDLLAELGVEVDPTFPSTGWLVYIEEPFRVVAIISNEDFAIQYQPVED